ncbi:MAG: hypothetical protein K6G27_03605 [Lachnospiraceae bacterium]|nr:hypothetical protein [Lachnospiraceae bacterium]
MELDKLTLLVKRQSPMHFRDICAALEVVSDELMYTKAALSNDLIKAQNRDNFALAREILDAQEALTEYMSSICNYLEQYMENEPDTEDDADLVEEYDQDEKIDYSLYKMDDTVEYPLKDTPVTFKRPAGFSLSGVLYKVSTWRMMLSQTCNVLYKKDPNIILEMVAEKRERGKRQVKMSRNKNDIYSPALIKGSDIWVETNRSASEIRRMMITLFERYGISVDDVKVYFSRDYTELHKNDNK